MLICGIKFGHDGSVAVIDGDTLVFSVEMEKLGNRDRHALLLDLDGVFAVLADHGYAAADVDHFVVDGWHPGRDVFKWGERSIRLPRARYIQTPLSQDALRPVANRQPDFSYLSYPHYAGHAVGAYCAGPFAPSGESAYCLSWDGGMVPYVYYYDAPAKRMENLGPLFSVVGDLYAEVAAGRGPFAPNPSQWETLGTPGKIMAYVAYGEERDELVAELERLSSHLPALTDATIRSIYPANIDFLHNVNATPAITAASGEDVITSYHAFIRKQLLESLERITAAHPQRARNLCYAGGCALNIKWNQAIRESGIFDEIWIPPFPNDAGSALGTACCAMVSETKTLTLNWSVYSGPDFRAERAADGWESRECSIAELASLLHRTGEPVLFLDGRAELGPRALGNRSILAPAVRRSMKDLLNRLKSREDYRPVAPVCLEAHAPELFDPGRPDPFMLYDHRVRDAWRERIPAIQHLDGTARLQTVNAGEHPQLFALLSEYHALSGIPLLCNTSANFHHKGFFPDLLSATTWGKVNYAWTGGRLYSAPEKQRLLTEVEASEDAGAGASALDQGR